MFYLCENNAGTLTLFVEHEGMVEWCHTYEPNVYAPESIYHRCAVDIIQNAFSEFDRDVEGNEIDSFIDSDMTTEDYVGNIVFSSGWREYQMGIYYAFDTFGTAAENVRYEIGRLLNMIC